MTCEYRLWVDGIFIATAQKVVCLLYGRLPAIWHSTLLIHDHLLSMHGHTQCKYCFITSSGHIFGLKPGGFSRKKTNSGRKIGALFGRGIFRGEAGLWLRIGWGTKRVAFTRHGLQKAGMARVIFNFAAEAVYDVFQQDVVTITRVPPYAIHNDIGV